MRKNLIRILSSILFILVCSLVVTACKEKVNPQIKVYESYEIDTVIVGQEYDAMSVVKDCGGEQLVLTECFYFNSKFEQCDLEVYDKTKFITYEDYPILIKLEFEDEDLEGDVEMTLLTEVPATENQLGLLASWNQVGITRELTAKPEYLYDGVDSVIKVIYNKNNFDSEEGSYGTTFMDTLKGKMPNYRIPDDLSNVVYVMKLKNISNQDMLISAQWLVNGSGVFLPNSNKYAGNEAYFHTLPQFVLEANSDWVEYQVPLKHLGIVGEDVKNLVVRALCNIKNTYQPTPWRAQFLVGDIELIEYSQARFPSLEMRTDKEIQAEYIANKVVDNDDKEVYMTALQHGAKASRDFITDIDVVSYEGNITAPAELAGTSTSYLKFTTRMKTNYTGQNGTFLSIPFNMMSNLDGLWKAEYQNYDPDNTYVGFYVFHDNGDDYSSDLKFILAESNLLDCMAMKADVAVTRFGGIAESVVTKGDASAWNWQYVELSLANIRMNLISSEDVVLGDTQNLYVTAMNVNQDGYTRVGDSFTYYVDGFSIYQGSKLA